MAKANAAPPAGGTPADPGVTVKDDGPADLPRDIRWVYENWGKLFFVDAGGQKVFNKAKLKHAPSNGAIAMANYALMDQKAFFDKFVVKLIPKDAPDTEGVFEETEAQRLARLDPSFEDMKDFFALEVADD